MDLFDVVRSCFRRWYLLLPMLLAVAWFSNGIYTSVQPVYYSSAVLGITPPSLRLDQAEAGVPVSRNGLVDVGGAPLITNMLAIGLRDDNVLAQVAAGGGATDYVSKMFPVPATSPELPLVMIEATEPDPILASKTVSLAVAQADPALRRLQEQANVPPDQMVTAFVVSPPSPPAAGMPSRVKSTLAVVLAGAGLSVVITVIADLLLTRLMARRRMQRTGAHSTATPPAEAVSPNGKADEPAPSEAGSPQVATNGVGATDNR